MVSGPGLAFSAIALQGPEWEWGGGGAGGGGRELPRPGDLGRPAAWTSAVTVESSNITVLELNFFPPTLDLHCSPELL